MIPPHRPAAASSTTTILQWRFGIPSGAPTSFTANPKNGKSWRSEQGPSISRGKRRLSGLPSCTPTFCGTSKQVPLKLPHKSLTSALACQLFGVNLRDTACIAHQSLRIFEQCRLTASDAPRNRYFDPRSSLALSRIRALEVRKSQCHLSLGGLSSILGKGFRSECLGCRRKPLFGSYRRFRGGVPRPYPPVDSGGDGRSIRQIGARHGRCPSRRK